MYTYTNENVQSHRQATHTHRHSHSFTWAPFKAAVSELGYQIRKERIDCQWTTRKKRYQKLKLDLFLILLQEYPEDRGVLNVRNQSRHLRRVWLRHELLRVSWESDTSSNIEATSPLKETSLWNTTSLNWSPSLPCHHDDLSCPFGQSLPVCLSPSLCSSGPVSFVCLVFASLLPVSTSWRSHNFLYQAC